MVNIITGQAVISIGTNVSTTEGPGRVVSMGETYIEVALVNGPTKKFGPADIKFVILERQSHGTIPSATPAPIYSKEQYEAGLAKYHPVHAATKSNMTQVMLNQPAYIPGGTSMSGSIVNILPAMPLAFKDASPFAEATVLLSAPTHASGGPTPATRQF